MTYDLAKQLKDAGFPLIELAEQAVGNSDSCIMCGKRFIQIDDRSFIEPTLPELIEACGDEEMFSLRKMGGMWYAAYGDGLTTFFLDKGSTSEEAVAKLWLALNKKA